MKKLLAKVVVAVAAVLLFTGCGINMGVVNNHNLNQTNVVLSQNNFKVVKTVEAEVSASYWFGIGGLNKKSLHDNAVAELTKEAGLTGSQALVNVTVHDSAKCFLIFTTFTCNAKATVIEFTK